jgi:hypothetical protein
MSTTVPPRHLRADVIDKRFEIQDLVRDTDQPLDAVDGDPKQLETLMVLLERPTRCSGTRRRSPRSTARR